MTQNSQADQIKIIVEAALNCAAQKKWQHVSMSDIAEQAEMDLDVLTSLAATRTVILQWIWDELDRRLVDAYLEIGAEEAADRHEKLFEAFMSRFDMMQEQRDAYVSICYGAWQDPVFMKRFMSDLQDSMIKMLHFLKVDLSFLGAYHTSALVLATLYTHVLKTWCRDESPDMAQTMAELDKRLTQIGGVYRKICDLFGRDLPSNKDASAEA